MLDQDFPQALYILATPIGNLADLSARASFVLERVSWVAAEDTREATKLLQHLGLTKELVSCNQHSELSKAHDLLQRIRSGESGAFVSDAGTPGISDPGALLVKEAHALGIRVVPIPGPSAFTTLLSVSGFTRSPISFYGFFPREKRQEFFKNLSAGTHVFFESPNRVEECLAELAQVWPDSALAMGRELTKRFEEVRVATAKDLLLLLKERPDLEKRGEFVFALEISEAVKSVADQSRNLQALRKLLQDLRDQGSQQKQLLRVATEWGLTRNEAYDLCLEILGK